MNWARLFSPMSYDIRQFAKLGLLHELIADINADAPSPAQVAKVKDRVIAAIADIRDKPGDLTSRLNNAEARGHSRRVHRGPHKDGRAMGRVMMRVRPAPTHDLIRLRGPIALTADEPMPGVGLCQPLRRAPWVVVRRGYLGDGMISVGVRGMARHERFAAWLAIVGNRPNRCHPKI